MSDFLPSFFDGSPEVDPYQLLFPVHLTGAEQIDGTWYYDWTEQSFDPATGSYLDADSPRSGRPTDGPFLVEINNNQVETPSYAWARTRGIVNGDPYYEIVGTIQNSITVQPFVAVTNVCVTATGSDGDIKSIGVQYSLIDPTTGLDIESWCVTNPTGCCGGSGSGTGCPDGCGGCTAAQIPSTVCVVIEDLAEPSCCSARVLPGHPDNPIACFQMFLQQGGGCIYSYIRRLVPLCPDGNDGPCDFGLTCIPNGTWQFGNLAFNADFLTATSVQCSPFKLVFEGDLHISGLCWGHTFRVTITEGLCTPCWGGSGSGGGGCSCTPGSPSTLHLTIGNVASCPCLEGSYAMLWNTTDQAWETIVSNACETGGTLNVKLFCSQDNTSWTLQATCNGTDAYSELPTSVSCSPFQLTFPEWGLNNCCIGEVSLTVTL